MPEQKNLVSKLNPLFLALGGVGLAPFVMAMHQKTEREALRNEAEKNLIEAERIVAKKLNHEIANGLGALRLEIQKIAGVGAFLRNDEIITSAAQTYEALNTLVTEYNILNEKITKIQKQHEEERNKEERNKQEEIETTKEDSKEVSEDQPQEDKSDEDGV